MDAQRLLQLISLGAALLVFLGGEQARADEDPGSWSNAAAELTRQGLEHAREGNEALATRRFAEAAVLDPSYGPAYLELARARERAGDLAEAVRVYDVAVSRVPHFVAAYRARAAVERRLGWVERELTSLYAAARLTEDSEVLRDIANRYAENNAWPAALATWRRILSIEVDNADLRAIREASVHIRALVVLCAELDPVSVGRRERGWVRAAEASIAAHRPP